MSDPIVSPVMRGEPVKPSAEQRRAFREQGHRPLGYHRGKSLGDCYFYWADTGEILPLVIVDVQIVHECGMLPYIVPKLELAYAEITEPFQLGRREREAKERQEREESEARWTAEHMRDDPVVLEGDDS